MVLLVHHRMQHQMTADWQRAPSTPQELVPGKYMCA
jgi:hypothetical protein